SDSSGHFGRRPRLSVLYFPFSEATPPSTTPPAQPPANTGTPQKSVQEKALTSALAGGSSVVSWSTQKNHSVQPGPTAAIPVDLSHPKKSKAQLSVYSAHLVHKEVSPFELLQGTVIPAVLETGVKSDIPGEMTAIVRNPVYSSVSGATLLIPAGSKLVGTYNSHIIAGDTRVAVAWTRVLFPNGTYIDLGKGMPGSSDSGYSGFHDLVDNHTWAIFRSALLLSIIDVGMAVSSPQQTQSANGVVSGNVALAEGEQGLAQTFGEAEAQLLQREINIAPTLTIPPGYPFEVVVTKDLVFPGPYQRGTNVESQPVMPVAGPTTIDRYGPA
ncbi:TrbI/VirB10 family protein, partial [Acidithiobacillus sp. MC6.1]|nr:TrbI/VirB10 family protein [Acidithiobacillus sp. MC6.1]